MRHAAPVVVLLGLVGCTLATAPVYDGVVRDEGDGLMVAYMVPYSSDNHA